MRGKRFSIGLRAALAIFTMTLLATSTWAATNWYEKVLYNFGNGTDAADAYAGLIFDAAGNLYGTTRNGGTYGAGAVFELTPAAGGDWTEQVLHSFGNGTDGAHPYFAGLIFDAAGNLYGTTVGGGDSGYGTVFELTPTAGGGWTELVLYSFCSQTNCTDGDAPYAGLILDAAGNLYGTTFYGGTYGGAGTVFELTPAAGGGWTEQVLHSFNGADGADPYAGLIVDAAGNLYGTTNYGGTYGGGTVFELTPTAGGGWTETVLHSFGNTPDGAFPVATGLIFDAAGDLYGTTAGGGVFKNCYPNAGCGTVFELTPDGKGGWTETVLYSFKGYPTDGAVPYAGLIFDRVGNLYGTTAQGGTYPCGSYSCGTVFELTPTAGGGWTETVLHSFGNGTDGNGPTAGLIFDRVGNLYSTTEGGGTLTYGGTAFELTPVYPCARCVVSGEVDVLPAESRDVPEQGGLSRR